MVLDTQRDRLDWWLVPAAKALRNVNPNFFTWLSLLAAIGAGIAFWQSSPSAPIFLLIGWALVCLNGICDVLDGKIAKMTGKASPRGDYLDHVIDRFSDTAFIGGLAFSGFVTLSIGFWALVATLLVSYLGTQAQAVGMGRNYGGLLGRADRLALLMTIPLIQFFFPRFVLPYLGLNLIETTMIYFAVAGGIATIQRFISGLRQFDARGQLK